MRKKIRTALISVYYKDGLGPVVKTLAELGITIYSTGGTQQFIEDMGLDVIPVEKLTGYPSILGGRVKTLHPSVFGGILGKRDDEDHQREMTEHAIPAIDLVIVDLYPFEETVRSVTYSSASQSTAGEAAIIEKIDIGGPSMIRGAAKNFRDVVVIAAKKDYFTLQELLIQQHGETTLEQRKEFAAKAFGIVAHYDVAIAKYFNPAGSAYFLESISDPTPLRYGENPHQQAVFYGNLGGCFEQLHGKELSYNNLVDVDAAVQLISEFSQTSEFVFAIIKHTNVCGIAQRGSVPESWHAALAGDPESAFGGVLVCNGRIDRQTADAISEIFFEVLLAPAFDDDALTALKAKKNRILLVNKLQGASPQEDGVSREVSSTPSKMYRSLLQGVLVQQADEGNYTEWNEAGARASTSSEREDLVFANLVCKHLKSNAIALVKNKQLVGKGCGQTSRIDSLRQALEKARQFQFDLSGAVMASDAFFPFDDCVKMGHAAGITAYIQPGGSIRDKDSIDYCKAHNLALVITGRRHFKH